MGSELFDASERMAYGHHVSCSMSAVLIARVHAYGGDPAVGELLRRAAVDRPLEYLLDSANWLSYGEAIALWQAGAHVTHHPDFARKVGEDAVVRMGASPVAELLRSLGSPEAVYRQLAIGAAKFSTVSRLEAIETRPGYAEVIAAAEPGFTRSIDHCAWTRGLLSSTPSLFGLPPATVEHDECAAYGAEHCVYRITWNADRAVTGPDSSTEVGVLRNQLDAMRERLNSMFATAADLIGAEDISGVLARITDRAAVEVRAPRYLLAVRIEEDGELHCHQRGLDEQEALGFSQRILEAHPASLPDCWLVAPVRSNRRDYGRLLAMADEGREFFPQERELLTVYARYAASALDSAAALLEAKQRYAQSSALLELARTLATAGTSGEIARRLADAVPTIVDCDRVAVSLWDPKNNEIVERALNRTDGVVEEGQPRFTPQPGGLIDKLLERPNGAPLFIDSEHGSPYAREVLAQFGAVSSILVPLASADAFLGLLAVSVSGAPERLRPTPDLLDRLSGIAAQAATALQNGRLVDEIRHQALHDELTGLANRLQFMAELRAAIGRARGRSGSVTLLYIDLDGFKPVNDRLGHEAGDQVLVAVAQRLAASTRSGDTVARLGGDEFAVLIDAQAESEDIDSMCRRLARAFAEPFAIGPQRLSLGASIGRASFPEDAGSAEELLRLADAAMFEHKRGSRREAA